MGFFDKAKNMYSLQKQAKAVKNELKSIHIESETDGIKVVVNGEQELMSIEISDSTWADAKSDEFGKKKLENSLLKNMNKAMKKAQEVAGSKMKGIWEQMGVPQQ